MDLQVDKQKESNGLKSCDDCQTTRTPLWRGGPGGPKSLCNACGIKYHKRRRQLMGMQTAAKSNNKATKKKRSSVARRRNRRDFKMRFMAIGSQIALHGSAGGCLMREEERAALLLMAMSCGGGGSVYA